MRRPFAAILVLLCGLSLAGCDSKPEPPPNLGALPELTLTDQAGTPITRDALTGQPTVMNFIFTRCPDRCPVFTARFANLQRSLDRPDVAYLSVSVDPEYDTPEVLAAYAKKYRADPGRWRFASGGLEDLRERVLAAFREHLEGREIRGELDLMEIVHGELFVLIDAAGQIRGFYGSDEGSERRLKRALDHLAASAAPAS